MPRRTDIKSILIICGALALSACVTARMHSVEELNSVGRQCGLAAGELFQDEEEKSLLFLMRVAPTREERVCVARWAKKNRLHLVYLEAIDGPAS
jgi:hypothetical protein